MVRRLYNLVKYNHDGCYHIGFAYYEKVNGRLEYTGKCEEGRITEEQLYYVLQKANFLREVTRK